MKLCLSEGIQIINLSRHRPPLDDQNFVHLETNLTKEKSIINVVDEIKNTYTKFDALINCAGVPSIQKPNAITYNELEDLMKVNTMAPIFLTSQLFDLIKENEADIVNIGSTQGLKQGRLNCCAYVTSKWALRGTSQNLQLELANTRCRVIQFNVGGMNTKMHYKYNGEIIENPDEWMQPKDVASLMLYLLRLPKQLEVGEIAINRKKL